MPRTINGTVATLALLVLFCPSPSQAIEVQGVHIEYAYPGDDGTLTQVFIWPQVPGLVTADFWYGRFVDPNSGEQHHVKAIGAMPHRRGFGDGWERWRWQLRDRNGDDRSAGLLRWGLLSPNYRFGTISSSSCSGTCRIPMPVLRSNEVFVLAGFEFVYTDPDHWIREVSIDPEPYRGYVDVTFTDNSGSRPYTASIAWVAMSSSEVARLEGRRSTTAAIGSASVSRTAGRALLQGFSLEFTNGDHYLSRLAVDVDSRVVVRLRDTNADDPFHWSVDYVIVDE